MGTVKAQAAIMVMPQEVARDGFAGWWIFMLHSILKTSLHCLHCREMKSDINNITTTVNVTVTGVSP
jgi:hypothetical protein